MFRYGIDKLTTKKALLLANGQLKGVLDEPTKAKIQASRNIVENLSNGAAAVYGVNTGFGPLCTTRISKEDTSLLQHNILKSHSVGMGKPVSSEISNLMLVLKIQALSKGYSGVAVSTIERIMWLLENDLSPIVPSQGSVGASGDLAPLSHLFLPLIGLGKVKYKSEEIESSLVLEQFGLKPLILGAKEGLALINGTQFIAAYAVKVVERLHNCLNQADLIGALMIEGLLGSPKPFLSALHNLRPYKGTLHVAHRMACLLNDSEIVASHKDCDRVQDPYSLRCIPQVHGASRNAWLHLKELLEVELNAVTDNPVIIDENNAISGGNFHGQPLALPLDYACLAAAELGNISDRRTYLSLMGIAEGTPKLLMKDIGLNSAFMILQYTSAALVSENKTMCFPASADSIPTSLGQEDHVSMGSISGRKALQVVNNLEKILTVELLCASQAFDFHKHLRSTQILDAIHRFVRQRITHADEDRIFADDMEKALSIIKSGELIKIANEVSLKYQLGLESEHNDLFEIL